MGGGHPAGDSGYHGRAAFEDSEKEFSIKDTDIFKINGPLDLTFLMKMYGMEGFEDCKYQPYQPQPVPAMNTEEDLFTQIRRGDILLHHPYMTFDPVVNFVKQAAKDPNVLAIKQTLYRVSGNSPIIAALAQAAENGKQVSVLVELKARFDEENNIIWAKMLEKAGCHVIYGLVGLKTHSKITLVVRREEDGIRRYVHLGTGNYNDSTAKLYTDCGLLTCSEPIGEDATAVFNMLSGYSEPKNWNKLVVAPIWLRNRFLRLIGRETKNALEGKEARIIAKMNSLCDKDIIAALYEASAAGVKIELIVRGNLLPESRDSGSERQYIRALNSGKLPGACQDLLLLQRRPGGDLHGKRGLDAQKPGPQGGDSFPVESEELKREVCHILDIQLEDNVKAHILQPDGNYEKIDKRGKVLINSQEYFCQEALERGKQISDPVADRVFIPAEPLEDIEK